MKHITTLHDETGGQGEPLVVGDWLMVGVSHLGWVDFSLHGFTSISYVTVVGTAKVMKTLRENVMRTGVTKQRRKRRMKKYLMKCFCTKHFSSTISVLDNTDFHHYVQYHDA